ncbi:MAG: LysR substrate-binding domain-containing protein [Hyphomicrobiaceae bacterium]
MNITHVLAFHRVAAAGSFTGAARLSGVSQPTLSAQVRALEAATGLQLFVRTGRLVRLSAQGETLFQATSRLAGALQEVDAVLTGEQAKPKGSLRISADSAVHVVPILAEMKRRQAGFLFSICINNSAAVLSDVVDDRADIGVMAQPSTDPRLEAVKIRADRLVLLVAAKDMWAGRKRVRLTELSGRDLVVRERGSITREVIEARLDEQAVRPGQVFDVATREAVREAVAAGFGVGVVFASEAGQDARLRTLSITGADLTVAEYIVCRADRRRVGLIARFLEAAERHATTHRWIV